MRLKHRIYVQFLIAILPLGVLIVYQAFSRNDLPQRVNTALRSYDLSLEASNAFKGFLDGVTDAVDSGQLGSSAIAALRRAKASEDKLATAFAEEGQLSQRIERLLAAVSASPSLSAIMPLKDEVQSLRTALADSLERRHQALTSLLEQEESAARRKQEVMLAAGSGALLLVGFTAFILRRLVLGITQPIATSVAVANAIADGRLDNSIRVTGNDEIAQLLTAIDRMQQQLSAIVRSVRAGAQSVARASETLSSETLDLSQRSEEQAANLEEAAASMEELSSTVKENTVGANQSNELARGAAQAAQKGGAAVTRVVATMREITESSRRIEDIVGVIDGIAFQTNILALNAAVEAARAGEHGRGFAVVASEVRSLSQRCATAATEIKALIAASVAKIEGGGRQANEAGGSIETLVSDVTRVSALMSQIAAASLEQQRGIEQVTASVTQMDGVVQQNAVAVQRSAAASEKLKRDALDLARTVSQVQLPEDSHPEAAPVAGDRVLAAPAYLRLRTPRS
jgi:methyl-accepting chemotaxis protein